ncbi:unnamed protein product [Pedinophyceae sp. YPF-701]|nr:unnamed protein product [Pedinophyceae sp. YPF-701]
MIPGRSRLTFGPELLQGREVTMCCASSRPVQVCVRQHSLAEPNLSPALELAKRAADFFQLGPFVAPPGPYGSHPRSYSRCKTARPVHELAGGSDNQKCATFRRLLPASTTYLRAEAVPVAEGWRLSSLIGVWNRTTESEEDGEDFSCDVMHKDTFRRRRPLVIVAAILATLFSEKLAHSQPARVALLALAGFGVVCVGAMFALLVIVALIFCKLALQKGRNIMAVAFAPRDLAAMHLGGVSRTAMLSTVVGCAVTVSGVGGQVLQMFMNTTQGVGVFANVLSFVGFATMEGVDDGLQLHDYIDYFLERPVASFFLLSTVIGIFAAAAWFEAQQGDWKIICSEFTLCFLAIFGNFFFGPSDRVVGAALGAVFALVPLVRWRSAERTGAPGGGSDDDDDDDDDDDEDGGGDDGGDRTPVLLIPRHDVYVENPLTGRAIKVGAGTHKKLVQDGWVLHSNGKWTRPQGTPQGRAATPRKLRLD